MQAHYSHAYGEISKKGQRASLDPGHDPKGQPLIIQQLLSGVNPGHTPGLTSHCLYGLARENIEFGIRALQSSLVHIRVDCPIVLPHDDYRMTCALDLIRRLIS